MKLYNFFRSGTSHRLRIALNLKGLTAEYVAVDLRAEEHLGAAFKALNPQGLVPALVVDDAVLIQSPAIIEWLEERYPAPALLPADPQDRARVRALAAIVGCDIHPINNRRILEYLRKTLGCDEAAVLAWCGTWINDGFAALEALLAADTDRGHFCFGHAPTLADAYLVPQVESARRFKVDLTPYPNIVAIDTACAALDAFRLAAPGLQPDAA
jgi:maleylpyruvate isomerase